MNYLNIQLVRDAVLKKCGDTNGLITDPTTCGFKPESLACKPGQTFHCLTEPEVTVLKKWYAGPKNSKGERLYPGGLPLGSEAYWPLWLTGDRLIPAIAENFLRYMAFQDDPGEPHPGEPSRVSQFDFDKDPPRLDFMAKIYNAMSPDLGRFKARSGKLLMYQGLADVVVTPQNTLDYYDKVTKASGGDASDYFRLFMIPGMDHCGLPYQLGPGITEAGFDPLTALEQWVEAGKAPDKLVARKFGWGGERLWT